MTKEANYKLIFGQLKQNFQELVPPLIIKEDKDDNFYLITPPSPTHSKELFFGAVQIKKNYVSYHLIWKGQSASRSYGQATHPTNIENRRNENRVHPLIQNDKPPD